METRRVGMPFTKWSQGLAAPNQEHRPNDAASRILRAERCLDLSHIPRFRLNRSDTFYCIGSCFAREIEGALLRQRLRVLSQEMEPERFGVTPEDDPHHKGVTGILTKFNTFSMKQEIDRVVERQADHGTAPDESYRFYETNGLCWDPQLHRVPPGPRERVQRIRAMVDANFAKLREASVVVITLGLTELWWDIKDDLALNDRPIDWSQTKPGGRLEFRNPGFAANLASVEHMIRQIRALNPEARVVISVSPVPLQRTFTGRDIIVANTYSKSVLRAVATEIVETFDGVDYFPSFEMVMFTERAGAWQHDQRHVSTGVVNAITHRFLEAYMPSSSAKQKTTAAAG